MEYFDFHTVIIGAGAAGLNCALWLVKYGIPPENIAIITENLSHGTSFDAGSDKQTYYKLSLNGDNSDNPIKMAHSLYDGGAMHGDIALIESTMSTQAFMHLVSIGVPFPQDETGAFVGYKTDNDPLQRGTSAGPLTSHLMGTQLLNEVKRYGIMIYDRHYSFQILKSNMGQACGILTFDLSRLNQDYDSTENLKKHIFQSIHAFHANHIVLATGGPAGCYQYSVYPETQWGSTGLAIQAGCSLQNLTESQFGLASLKFRWNVSGTYQQVIPKYISLPPECDQITPETPPIEFLNEYFPSMKELTKATFLKGYQWPFNPQRIENYGSSLIDLAVHHEIHHKGRKVFMDFRSNVSGFSFDGLDSEPKDYLYKSGALQPTPIERLAHMNAPAIELYHSHNIDLWKEPLEIGICAQHCNGGVTGDIWWQTSVPNLYAIGEVNGSHGVHRPGGAALNSGQVGGIRAAMHIAYGDHTPPTDEVEFEEILLDTQTKLQNLFENIQLTSESEAKIQFDQNLKFIHARMNRWGMYIRTPENLSQTLVELEDEIKKYSQNLHVAHPIDIISVYRHWDALLTQHAILSSIQIYLDHNGGSRGSSIVLQSNKTQKNQSLLPAILKIYEMKPELDSLRDELLEIRYQPISLSNEPIKLVNFPNWVKRRKIPSTSNWFETIYNDYRNRLIFKLKTIR
jgi:succinate dehydrogenase/fumarate reductase flavoprotein subunit